MNNPYQLTIKQHIIPRISIERFYKSSPNGIDIYYKEKNKIIHNANSKNNLFYGKKIWDQKTESVRIKDVEDRFQNIAEKIINQGIEKIITEEENVIITQFYSLWLSRQYFYENPEPEIDFGFKVDKKHWFTRDEQESLESKGAVVLSVNGNLPSHFSTGLIIMGKSQQIYDNLINNAKWGIIQSDQEQEFIFPDCFKLLTAIPLTPSKLLYSNTENFIATENDLIKINRYAIKSSKKFYFARNLENCPV